MAKGTSRPRVLPLVILVLASLTFQGRAQGACTDRPPPYAYAVANTKVPCNQGGNAACPACDLWTKVVEICGPPTNPNCSPSDAGEFGLPIPAGEFSVDPTKLQLREYLILPGSPKVAHAYRGVEDYAKSGEDIWDYAYGVAMNGHALVAKPFDIHNAGLAINPPSHRAAHQMHIHVAKLNPTLRKSLNTAAWGTKPFSTWIDIPNPVGQRVLRAKFVRTTGARPGSDARPFESVLNPSPPQGITTLAKLDGHTAPTEWINYGILVTRESATDKNQGYFVVGLYDYPASNMLCAQLTC